MPRKISKVKVTGNPVEQYLAVMFDRNISNKVINELKKCGKFEIKTSSKSFANYSIKAFIISNDDDGTITGRKLITITYGIPILTITNFRQFLSSSNSKILNFMTHKKYSEPVLRNLQNPPFKNRSYFYLFDNQNDKQIERFVNFSKLIIGTGGRVYSESMENVNSVHIVVSSMIDCNFSTEISKIPKSLQNLPIYRAEGYFNSLIKYGHDFTEKNLENFTIYKPNNKRVHSEEYGNHSDGDNKRCKMDISNNDSVDTSKLADLTIDEDVLKMPLDYFEKFDKNQAFYCKERLAYLIEDFRPDLDCEIPIDCEILIIPSNVYSIEQFDIEYALTNQVNQNESLINKFLLICNCLGWDSLDYKISTCYSKKQKESLYQRIYKTTTGRMLLMYCKTLLESFKNYFKISNKITDYQFLTDEIFLNRNRSSTDTNDLTLNLSAQRSTQSQKSTFEENYRILYDTNLVSLFWKFELENQKPILTYFKRCKNNLTKWEYYNSHGDQNATIDQLNFVENFLTESAKFDKFSTINFVKNCIKSIYPKIAKFVNFDNFENFVELVKMTVIYPKIEFDLSENSVMNLYPRDINWILAQTDEELNVLYKVSKEFKNILHSFFKKYSSGKFPKGPKIEKLYKKLTKNLRVFTLCDNNGKIPFHYFTNEIKDKFITDNVPTLILNAISEIYKIDWIKCTDDSKIVLSNFKIDTFLNEILRFFINELSNFTEFQIEQIVNLKILEF